MELLVVGETLGERVDSGEDGHRLRLSQRDEQFRGRQPDRAVLVGQERRKRASESFEDSQLEPCQRGADQPSSRMIGNAEKKGVPILLLQTDTLSAIDRVESVVSEDRTRDAATVTRMQSLLPDHADVDALLG